MLGWMFRLQLSAPCLLWDLEVLGTPSSSSPSSGIRVDKAEGVSLHFRAKAEAEMAAL